MLYTGGTPYPGVCIIVHEHDVHLNYELCRSDCKCREIIDSKAFKFTPCACRKPKHTQINKSNKSAASNFHTAQHAWWNLLYKSVLHHYGYRYAWLKFVEKGIPHHCGGTTSVMNSTTGAHGSLSCYIAPFHCRWVGVTVARRQQPSS